MSYSDLYDLIKHCPGLLVFTTAQWHETFLLNFYNILEVRGKMMKMRTDQGRKQSSRNLRSIVCFLFSDTRCTL